MNKIVATISQATAFAALVASVLSHPKSMKLTPIDCDGVALSATELCALLERDSEKMPDDVVENLRKLGCVGVAAGKTSFAVGVRKIRSLMSQAESP